MNPYVHVDYVTKIEFIPRHKFSLPLKYILYIYVPVRFHLIVLKHKLVFRQLRGVLDHFNHLQIYISKRQLSDVSDVLILLRHHLHHLKFLVCQGPIMLHMDVR